jgi:predicted dienelactone hydrolase
VSAPAYASDVAAQAVCEAGDVLAEPDLRVGVRPLTCRWPRDRAPEGFVVFCHGLGSNGGEYAELSRHWAAHGYLVIHPTFPDAIDAVARREPQLGLDPEADLSGWTALPHVRARMHEILHDPKSWMARLAIVGDLMDRLPGIFEATCAARAAALPGAIAGHSFGAYTAQLLAGAEIDLPDAAARRFADPRFRAAILLSAQGRDQQGLRDGSWDRMDGPVLTVTGTRDQGAKGGDWRWKSEPFERAPPGGKVLMVLDEADHFLGGFAPRGPGADVPAQREALRQVSLAFLDAELRGRTAARDWLAAVGDRIAGHPVLFKRK